MSESVYLEAGQSYEFTNFSHQTGALIYIYQADRMSMLDLSEISLGSSNGEIDFSGMLLVVSLILGSATHTEIPTGYRAMSSAICRSSNRWTCAALGLLLLTVPAVLAFASSTLATRLSKHSPLQKHRLSMTSRCRGR